MNALTPDPQRSGGVTEAPSARAPTFLQVMLFFVITFALTWVLFLPLVLRVFSQESDEGRLLLLGAIGGPTITAFGLAALTAGRDGVRRLWWQGTRWRVGAGWYALVLAGPGLAVGASLAVAAALGGQAPSVNPWLPAVVAGLLAGILEEFGWMGFAFPALQARYGALWAGVAMGVAVALWHLPFFFIPGTTQASSSFVFFLVLLIALRILFGWIYNGTGGSILIMILFHGSWDTWEEILGRGPMVADPYGLMLAAILWVGAVIVLLMNRRAAQQVARA